MQDVWRALRQFLRVFVDARRWSRLDANCERRDCVLYVFALEGGWRVQSPASFDMDTYVRIYLFISAWWSWNYACFCGINVNEIETKLELLDNDDTKICRDTWIRVDAISVGIFVFIRSNDLNFMWVVLLRESDRVELEARFIFL